MQTYDEFNNAANKAGMLDRFSQRELEAIQKNPELGVSLLGLMQDEQNASSEEQRLLAREAANQMRKNYGLLDTGTAMPASSAPVGDQYAGVLDQAASQGSFAYDPEKDPVWAAYQKQYSREGDRAAANALAQASAASGGRPSSYAVTAAQQAGNYYAGQMSDIIPDLAQNAYQQYLNDKQLEMQRFQNALALYDTMGYATPEAAEILGISGGKSDSDTPGATGSAGPKTDVAPNTTDSDLLNQMLGELQNTDGEANVDDYRVLNDFGDGWVAIGGSKLTWPELLRAVNQGEVLEIVDPKNGTITYKFAEKKESGGGSKPKPGGGDRSPNAAIDLQHG